MPGSRLPRVDFPTRVHVEGECVRRLRKGAGWCGVARGEGEGAWVEVLAEAWWGHAVVLAAVAVPTASSVDRGGQASSVSSCCYCC